MLNVNLHLCKNYFCKIGEIAEQKMRRFVEIVTISLLNLVTVVTVAYRTELQEGPDGSDVVIVTLGVRMLCAGAEILKPGVGRLLL